MKFFFPSLRNKPANCPQPLNAVLQTILEIRCRISIIGKRKDEGKKSKRVQEKKEKIEKLENKIIHLSPKCGP